MIKCEITDCEQEAVVMIIWIDFETGEPDEDIVCEEHQNEALATQLDPDCFEVRDIRRLNEILREVGA